MKTLVFYGFRTNVVIVTKFVSDEVLVVVAVPVTVTYFVIGKPRNCEQNAAASPSMISMTLQRSGLFFKNSALVSYSENGYTRASLYSNNKEK